MREMEQEKIFAEDPGILSLSRPHQVRPVQVCSIFWQRRERKQDGFDFE